MNNYRRFDRQRIDPVAYLLALGVPTEHITYDPKMRKGDYSIIRQSSHDGTLLFENELLGNTLLPIATRTSCHRNQEGLAERPEQVSYVVGPLRLSTVFGRVDLPCGNVPGMRQRTRMPVKCVISANSTTGDT